MESFKKQVDSMRPTHKTAEQVNAENAQRISALADCAEEFTKNAVLEEARRTYQGTNLKVRMALNMYLPRIGIMEIGLHRGQYQEGMNGNNLSPLVDIKDVFSLRVKARDGNEHSGGHDQIFDQRNHSQLRLGKAVGWVCGDTGIPTGGERPLKAEKERMVRGAVGDGVIPQGPDGVAEALCRQLLDRYIVFEGEPDRGGNIRLSKDPVCDLADTLGLRHCDERLIFQVGQVKHWVWVGFVGNGLVGQRAVGRQSNNKDVLAQKIVMEWGVGFRGGNMHDGKADFKVKKHLIQRSGV